MRQSEASRASRPRLSQRGLAKGGVGEDLAEPVPGQNPDRGSIWVTTPDHTRDWLAGRRSRQHAVAADRRFVQLAELIIPAPTVTPVASSMRMKEPVVRFFE